MALKFLPIPPDQATPVIAFPFARPKEKAFAETQLENMLAALAIHHGETQARALFTEAAIAVIARQAKATGNLAAARFACEYLMELEFGRQGSDPFDWAGRPLA